MRNRWIKMIASLLCITLASGCTGYDSSAEIDGVSFHITADGRRAFVSECAWDASMDAGRIVIPDTAEKAKVTSLGGFFGTGVPAPFCIMADKETYEFSDNPLRARYGAPLVMEEIPVTVVLPDTVTKVKYVSGTGYYGSRDEYGRIVFRQPAVRFECGEGNPAFTVQDGRLLNREDQSPAVTDEELYGIAEESEMTLRDRLLCRCVKDMGSETEIWDIVPEFGHVYVHIASCMDGTEYMFTALDLTPLEEGVLERTDTDQFDAEVRQFSDFAAAGMYTEPLYPYCRITADDSGIRFVWLDETKTPVMDSGIELPADFTKPSHFPVSKADAEPVSDGEKSWYPVSPRLERMVTHVLEGDGIRIRLYRDGTISILQDAQDTTVLYRGIALTCRNGQEDGLCFAVKKLGGSSEPYCGRVLMTLEEDTVTFAPAEGYESSPLMPEGEETLVCRIS